MERNIDYVRFDTIGSTNTWAKEHAARLNPHCITCITAAEQTAGRGRMNRRWVSPKGLNLYATLYFCLPKGVSYLANLGQVLSLSCASILADRGFAPQLKWPNDILLHHKKVSGILCEAVDLKDRRGVILGIGINVNMTDDLLNAIDQPATSLLQTSGRTWDLDEILNALLERFIKDLSVLQQAGFKPFREHYETLLLHKGKAITCRDGAQQITGILDSINDDGSLNLELPSKELIALSSGEILNH
jgi:BirA family transcriptional regulator, biotin operon repressor / biotin---[acetyl-CoA-carboxylase] ligase